MNLLKELISIVAKHDPELAKKITVVPVGIDSATNAVKFETDSPMDHINNKSVLLFDSAMHTGRTMCRIVNEAIKLGAANVATYSLVMKIGSYFIPTFWGVIIDDTDRIYFLLKKIPNGRLDSGPEFKKDGTKRKIPCVYIRRLCEEHLQKPPVICGLKSLDRVLWGDRYFDMQAGDHKECTYVLQTAGEIVGYMSLHFADTACLFISEIAIAENQKEKGYGPILMRFADTLARQSNCLWVRLNAIENKISFYEGFGYTRTPGREPIKLDDEVYHPMEHKVVCLPFKSD